MKNYLDSAIMQFRYYKMLGEKTMDQLEEAELFWSPGTNENSIAIIVKHLRGNMLSRWTDFLNSDGEKDWRNRDEEFEIGLTDRIQIIHWWNQGWEAVFSAMESLEEKHFDQLVYIRNEEHTLFEAINRQLCHYAYHVGQMVFVGKILKGDNWKSLSIPLGKSQEYNKQKFS
jgi:hypothetical protein